MEIETQYRVAKPFKTLEELYSKLDDLKPWPDIVELRDCVDYVFSTENTETINEKLEKLDREQQPKTIVCHDMKGGYLEDRFIDGCDAHDSYVFYNWTVIDTFIYFSHNLITIPPYGWITTAHNHGVKILGTIITEHGDGVEIWEKILATTEETEKFANALVRLAKFYNFEGWLLNVENKIKQEDINKLIYFVKFLTDRIHEEIEGSEIIWYDSVTCTGELVWQNQLNDKNLCYFLKCDGIFLNYNWTERGLASSLILAKKENREKDVYVGLDVWGRGCPGGGGFNSAYAIKLIRKHGLSVAIFAQGWTHEYFGPTNFHKVEDIFWAQLMPYLYIHVPIFENESFVTSFCRGIGINHYSCGKISNEEPGHKTKQENRNAFYNLNKQKYQTITPWKHSKIISVSVLEDKEEKNDPGISSVKPLKEEDSSKKENPVKKEREYNYETGLDIMNIRGQQVIFRPKLTPVMLNYLEFHKDFAFDGGGCIRFVTNDPVSHYRLFLVHIEFARDIQASVTYRLEDASDQAYKNNLYLILGNNFSVQTILPFQTIQLDSGWKKSIYLTSLKTVNEIGVTFLRRGSCSLGEIVVGTLNDSRGQWITS
ncbi:cytosolic endo-beta-N-acetylglucosaminidase [Leptopilina boulardi]|uniref:cytosolic endo-beta-N-acetylglucosaminidase n=1 Tax=Leptopilina boulardi TaxID=63433 RepID=UPI0021F61916|nr:cytosolic endo-beta-N-acetylglucosaminidase [Leptopilina boulardi]